MVTYESSKRFDEEFNGLSAAKRRAFMVAVKHLVDDLNSGHQARPGLRTKRVQGTHSVWEMTWAPDGRATFQYGAERRRGEPHIVWRHVGTHAILKQP